MLGDVLGYKVQLEPQTVIGVSDTFLIPVVDSAIVLGRVVTSIAKNAQNSKKKI